MSDDLPSSGDPGRRPPAPGSLPRPEMWPAGGGQTPFDRTEGDTATPPSPGRKRAAWAAVVTMLLGAVLVALAVARTSWVLLVAGVVVGLVGAAVAYKVRIMEDVSVSD
jgi:MFS family permease